MTTDRAIRSAIWLFLLLWLAVGSGIVILTVVALLGWLIAHSVEWIVAVAMWVSGT